MSSARDRGVLGRRRVAASTERAHRRAWCHDLIARSGFGVLVEPEVEEAIRIAWADEVPSLRAQVWLCGLDADVVPAGAEVLVLEDEAEETLLEAVSLASLPARRTLRAPDRMAAVLERRLLDVDGVVPFEAVTALREAFGADRAAAFVPDQGDPVICDRGLGEDSSRVRRRAALAARQGVPLLTVSAAGLQTILAAPLSVVPSLDDGLVCVMADGPAPFGRLERSLLTAIGRQLAGEIGRRRRRDGKVEADLAGHATLRQLLPVFVSLANRHRVPLTVAVLRLSEWPAVHAEHGAWVAAQLVEHVGHIVQRTVRAHDFVAQLDDEGSLAVVFHGATAPQAEKAIRRAHQALGMAPFAALGSTPRIPIAVGLREIRSPGERGDRALARARMAARRAAPSLRTLRVETIDGAADTLPAPAFDPVGLTLGGMYRVLHRIGEGGSGTVYRGEDIGLRRPVAIKILEPDLARDERFVAQFREEAATLAAIRDSNLVEIYAFGVDAGHVFFVMEMIEGESAAGAVQRRIRDGVPFELERTALIVEHIAGALDTLHRAGIVHRDVKPDNILMDPFRNRAVLVDVGIAQRHGADAVPAGTPGYMAPEMLRLEAWGPSVDVYGLAVTVYELLCHCLPWDLVGGPVEQLHHQTLTEARPPSSFDASLAPLDGVFHRALHPDPRVRVSTVGELASSLEEGFDVIRQARGEDGPASTGPSSVEAHAVSSRHRPRTEPEETTRGIVARSLNRVLGHKVSRPWIAELREKSSELADVLDAPPLAWLSTDDVVTLIRSAPTSEPERLARELGRETIRASFRRFFPASAATLAPKRTLSAFATIWAHYHAWGDVEVLPPSNAAARIRIVATPRRRELCLWVTGMLEQLVLLSGGQRVVARHVDCECDGAAGCSFEVDWAATDDAQRSLGAELGWRRR